MLGSDSYALLSRDYLNLSAKFGYHYANVDTFCGDDAGQDYIALQFSGGAGTYFGRSMRIIFLSEVLGRLGFSIVATGDLLEASLTGFYIHIGDWKPVVEEGTTLCLQDGSGWGTGLSSGMANLMGKMVGGKISGISG